MTDLTAWPSKPGSPARNATGKRPCRVKRLLGVFPLRFAQRRVHLPQLDADDDRGNQAQAHTAPATTAMNEAAARVWRMYINSIVSPGFSPVGRPRSGHCFGCRVLPADASHSPKLLRSWISIGRTLASDAIYGHHADVYGRFCEHSPVNAGYDRPSVLRLAGEVAGGEFWFRVGCG